jgi:CspA family cold shock protein
MSRAIGNVKWYDSKKGYGFVTLVTPDLENTGNDVFVHYSNINVSDGNYKRLFPGEYIEFEIGSGNDGRSVCLNVSGIQGGLLLCENENHRFKIFPRRDQVNESVEATGVEGVEDEGVEDEDEGSVKDC